MTYLAALVIGYLLGSISPAYILGRVLRHVDIREVGYCNAGTRNVYHELGVGAAVLTAVIDLFKGIGALLICRHVLRLSELFSLLPVAAAVAGHIFPFYLSFRGGKGMATAVGVWLFSCGRAVYTGQFSPLSLLFILVTALIIFLTTKNGDLTGLVSWCFLAIQTPLEMGISTDGLLMFALALFLFGMGVYNNYRRGVFDLGERPDLKPWRVIIRPLALLFIVVDLWLGRTVVIYLLGGVAVVFVSMDLIRIFSRVELRQFFKKGEFKRFSSMTSFLVSLFIVFLVFPGTIPHLGLAYITIGDMFSKVIGIKFGRRKLFKDRTLQGTLGFFAGSLAAGYILYTIQPLPLLFVPAGALFAALVELFSQDLDDNFTVAILSCGLLYALKYLQIG